MAGVAVVFGDLAGPNEVWLLPDRAATDKKVVGKVVRLEKELADLCCEEGEVVEGAMVAVRFGDGMARAEVVVAEEEVVLFLPDWGRRVRRRRCEVMGVPPGVRLPSRRLAQRLDLSTWAAPGSQAVLAEVVAACGGGRLQDASLTDQGAVTGTLVVALEPTSPLITRSPSTFDCKYCNCIVTVL